MHKILIVEDNIIAALGIEQMLMEMGYRVLGIVDTYDAAIDRVSADHPDLILIDIGLKGNRDGIEIARYLHLSTSIPFIYLTSDDSDATITRASKTSPSAYLTKPIRKPELKSNIAIALQPDNLRTQVPLGDYRYDLDTQGVFLDQTPIYLSPNEKRLLEILIEAKGNIVSFHLAEQRIWGIDSPQAESSLRTLVYRLRTKLSLLTIESIPSFGYRLYY